MRLNKICILIFTCCYNDHLYLDNTIIMCINLNSNKAPHAVVNFFFFFFFWLQYHAQDHNILGNLLD